MNFHSILQHIHVWWTGWEVQNVLEQYIPVKKIESLQQSFEETGNISILTCSQLQGTSAYQSK